MKSLKEKLVQEGLIKRQAGMDMKAKIEAWLKEHRVTGYTINKDLTIDVSHYVELNRFDGDKLPDYIQFGKCQSSFLISVCPNLKSLRGCPREVNGSFRCHSCPNLESLEGGPEFCSNVYQISSCPKITSLKGCPEIGAQLDASCTGIKNLEGLPDQESLIQVTVQGCQKLKSLKGSPKQVRAFNCSDCPKLESLDGGPEQVTYDFFCVRCPKLTSLDGMPKRIGSTMYCGDCGKKFSRIDAKKAGNIEMRRLSNQSPKVYF